VGPLAGQGALVIARECVKQELGGRVSKHSVAEELKALVGALLLGRHRRSVAKGTIQQLAIVESITESIFKFFERIEAVERHADILTFQRSNVER
jgi:hypothetical protein